MGFKLPFGKSKSKSDKSSFSTNPENTFVALDVGTRYIKSVIFRISSKSEISIIGYARSAQKFGAMRDAMIVNLQSVIEACDASIGRALDIAEKTAGGVTLPNKIIIGIAGELVKGVAIVANYDREKPESNITADELEDVVAQVKENSFKNAISEISEEIGIEPSQIEEINSTIDTTEINGVTVENPLGFTGEKVTYRVFSTFAPKLHVNSLYELAENLGFAEASIVVQPYAIARAMKGNKDSNSGEAIIIDMGGGTTDIALVHKGGVLGTKMFAFGGDALTHRIAEYFKLEMPAAEELKLKYSDGEASTQEAKIIKSIINQDLQIWIEGVQIALEELLDDENGDLEQLPGQIYLCGGGVALPEVREVLLSHPWLTVLPFFKFPKVNYLFPNSLKTITDQTKLLIDPSDITPASIARMLIDVG